jgi:hypothetical protein
MNLHHPSWGGPGTRTDAASEELLGLADRICLQQVVEPGTITWAKGGDKSTIDLAFMSQRMCERLVGCEVADDVEDDSDHNPIRILINIETPEIELIRRRNWKQTDAEEPKKFVDANLMQRNRDI